jgi:hypothetical protein
MVTVYNNNVLLVKIPTNQPTNGKRTFMVYKSPIRSISLDSFPFFSPSDPRYPAGPSAEWRYVELPGPMLKELKRITLRTPQG